MSYNLFYIIPQDETPGAKTRKIAVHLGEYPTKEAGVEASSKLTSRWSMALVRGDHHLPEILFDRECVQEILPSFASEVQKQTSGLKAAFVSLEPSQAEQFQPTDQGLQAWLTHYGEKWGHTNQPEVKEEPPAPQSAVIVGRIEPKFTPIVPINPSRLLPVNPTNHRDFD